jgi:hypothetical protein
MVDTALELCYNLHIDNIAERETAMTREATNKILELIDEGVLQAETVVMAALKYMSEDEVADMAHINEFTQFFDEEEEDEDDDMEWDWNNPASPHHY